MNHNLTDMNNAQLKAFIKANRNDEQACHEALKIIFSRTKGKVVKYPANIHDEEMQNILIQRLKQENK